MSFVGQFKGMWCNVAFVSLKLSVYEGWKTPSTGSNNLQIIIVILNPEGNILLLMPYLKSCLAQAQLKKCWS